MIDIIEQEPENIVKAVAGKEISVVITDEEKLCFFDGENRFLCPISREALAIFDETKVSCYDSKNILVTVIKEPFSSLEGFGDYTLANRIFNHRKRPLARFVIKLNAFKTHFLFLHIRQCHFG